MDKNKLNTIVQNNTELEFLGQKDSQRETLNQKPCQKGVIDERNHQIKHGLQGDLHFKTLASQNDTFRNRNPEINQITDQEKQNKKFEFSRQNQFLDKSQNISSIQLQENRNSCFQQSVNQEDKMLFEIYNKCQINVPLSQYKKNQEKQDFIYSCNQQKNCQEEILRCHLKNGIQAINKQKNRTSVSTIANSAIKKESTKNKQQNSLSKMVYRRIHVLDFIKKLKLISKSRKLESISKFQIEMIADNCYYLENNQSQANSILTAYLRRIPSLTSKNLIPIFSRDKIISERSYIIKKYILSFHFFTDFISIITMLTLIITQSNYITYNLENNIWKYLSTIMIFAKLYGVSQKVKRLEYVITLSQQSKHLYKLFCQIFSVLQIAHISCIGWYSLKFIQSHKTNWLQNINIQNSEYHIKYIYAFYWAIITMTAGKIAAYIFQFILIPIRFLQYNKIYSFNKVGYGDIIATNYTEALYISITTIIFSCVFAFSINNIGQILHDLKASSQNLKDRIQIIEKYLKRKNVNIQLKTRVVQYLFYLEDEINSRLLKEEEQVLSILSTKLREEIILEANSQIIKKFDIFRCFSQQTINKLVFVMKEIIVSPGETIFVEGDLDDSIYLIFNGQIEIFISGSQKNSQPFILKDLSNNQVFGEIAFFCQKPRSSSQKSIILSTLYKIKRKDFMQIIQQSQIDFEIFKTIQQNITLNEDYKQAQLKCYSCKQSTHTIQNCPVLHQKFDQQLINLKHNFNHFQERKNCQKQYTKLYSARMLKSLNQRLLSQLKMEQEYQNFFNSVFENTQQILSYMQIEEQKQYQEEFYQSKDIQNQQSRSSINNFDQISISKRNNFMDQQFVNINKNQIQQVFNKGLAKEKFDFNINYVINDESQIENEQEIYLNYLTDEYTVQNYNSLGDLCNRNENPNNTSYSVNRSNKKSTILKHQNYIENIEIDQPKVQYDISNLNDQESINLSSHLIAESYCSQEQKYRKQLSSITNLQLFPEERKNKSCNPNLIDNKMSKIALMRKRNFGEKEPVITENLEFQNKSSQGKIFCENISICLNRDDDDDDLVDLSEDLYTKQTQEKQYDSSKDKQFFLFDLCIIQCQIFKSINHFLMDLKTYLRTDDITKENNNDEISNNYKTDISECNKHILGTFDRQNEQNNKAENNIIEKNRFSLSEQQSQKNDSYIYISRLNESQIQSGKTLTRQSQQKIKRQSIGNNEKAPNIIKNALNKSMNRVQRIGKHVKNFMYLLKIRKNNRVTAIL
ncbi:hypothetical protein ABPG72_021808 [Tetrahymena utriculariae]